MNDLTGFYPLNRVRQRRGQRSVMFHSIPLNVDNHDSEGKFLEVVLEFEPFIGGDQNVTLPFSLCDQPRVREGAPSGFGNDQNLMTRKLAAIVG
jgi:hypothetical protein